MDTPIGRLPADGAIDTDGLDITAEDMAELLRVDEEQWRAQLPQFREHYAKFDRLPEPWPPSSTRSRSAWPRPWRTPAGV